MPRYEKGFIDRTDPEDVAESDVIECRYCKASVYWGPFYDGKGDLHRRLFNEGNRRQHACDPFSVIPEKETP